MYCIFWICYFSWGQSGGSGGQRLLRKQHSAEDFFSWHNLLGMTTRDGPEKIAHFVGEVWRISCRGTFRTQEKGCQTTVCQTAMECILLAKFWGPRTAPAGSGKNFAL